MKSKTLTYFLLSIVIAVWGIIFYRIFNAAASDEETPISQIVRNKSTTELALNTDYLVLYANYRDPFLGTAYKPVEASTTTIRRKPKTVAPKPPEVVIDWASIRLVGIIINTKVKSKVALMQYQGRELMLKEGQLEGDLKITKIDKDSVQVVYLGKSHVYHK